MNVCIEVGPVRLKITPGLSDVDFALLREKLTFVVFNYQFTKQHKEYGWDGKKRLLLKDQTAPTGCLYRIKYILEKKCGHTVEIVYSHDYKPRGTPDIHGLQLESFQKLAVQRAIKYRRAVIQAPVRAGKTAIAASIIKNIGHFPVWLITYGKDLVNQTKKDLEFHLQRQIGSFSEGEYEHGDIVVTSYQAITRALTVTKGKVRIGADTRARNEAINKMIRSARVFIFDECHHSLSPKNKNLLATMDSAGYVIGLSGTPKPQHARMLELEAALGSIVLTVKYKTLINHKRLARPMIIMYQMPYRWYSTGLGNYQDIYDSNVVENLCRNQFIADIVESLHKSGKTSFIMIRKLPHGPILRAMIPGSVFVNGSIDSKERGELYEALQRKDIHCIIATVGKEGLNIPQLNAVINAEGLKSKVTTIQKMRSLTAAEGKKYGIVIDFFDRGKYLSKHSKQRFSLYKTIQGSKIKIRKVSADFYQMEGSRWQTEI